MIAKCEAGHKKHEIIKVSSRLGEMFVYDTSQYRSYIRGYCHGKDDISRTISNIGVWEAEDTAIVQRLLIENRQENKDQMVIDFGCHVGWYSLLAADLGYDVIAIDGDKENIGVLQRNLEPRGFESLVQANYIWVDEATNPLDVDDYREIELVKIDLEGSERHAIRMIYGPIVTRRIKNIHIEVSPCFNSSYPEIIRFLEEHGYRGFEYGKEFDHNYNFSQKNLLFKR